MYNRLRPKRVAWIAAVLLLAGCAAGPGGGGGGATNGADRDGDGLSDDRELALGTNPDLPDTDGDGLADGAEVELGTNPLLRDTDEDGLIDGADPEPLTPNLPADNGSRSSGNDREPNDSFEQAGIVTLRDQETAVADGLIDRDADVDVYDVGSLSVGDSLRIDVVRSGGGLAPDVAVFDAQQRLYAENDGDLTGEIDGAVVRLGLRRTSPRFFVAVRRGRGSSGQGAYHMTLALARGQPAPATSPQTVYLDFDGGMVDSPVLGQMTLAPFDAAAIDPVYRSQTARIKAGIIAAVEQNYTGYNLTLATSDDGAEPPRPFTRMWIGGFSETVFGLSEAVDLFNMDRCDDGLIFAESFSQDVFCHLPTVDQLALAIGNVTSHELGHLLGLNHVINPLDLMDAASPADTLLLDQEFLNSMLDERIFPIGTQDSALLLTETLGPG